MKPRSLFSFALFFVTFSAFAEDDTRIKVTSFALVNPFDTSLRVAEICGKVLIPMEPSFKVFIAADPGNKEGIYSATPDSTGRWCHLIYASSGRARVTLSSGTTNLSSFETSMNK